MLLPELLLLLGLAVSMSDSYDGSVNYWEAFSPGKLLQRLDALTLTDVDQSKMGKLPEMIQVLAETQSQAKAQAEPKADEDVDVADDDVESLSGETSHEAPHSSEDYERNYEKFVKEYFDRASSDDGDEGSSSLEQTQVDTSNHKDQRCRRVQRQGQLCEICRQAKNNEVSETCSYSNAEQPQKYAYDSGSQYKRYRDNPQEDDDGSEQESVTVEAKEESSAPSSLCVRRQKGKRVCYQCKDSKGKRLERCYDVQEKQRKEKALSAVASKTKTKSKASSSNRKPRAQQSQQSEQEQRIYKRTISYSYAKGTNPDEEQPQPAEITTEAVALPANQHRRRRLVKILRRRGPVP
ncbi:uncharacterized protein LOC108164730 [Drosophila miranda]|uniref:uncharacterized protein LOC108164730 n=1 Tax=Drosophila miranda TaxID=7229 RepID=UPI00143F4DB9|nr:uncharacterized protein LOC108164730 [Drosophila miranda]